MSENFQVTVTLDGVETPVGNPVLTTDHAGNADSAYLFSGKSQYVSLAQTPGLPIHSETLPYTVAMWVKGAGTQADNRIYSEGSSLSQTPLFTLGTNYTKLRMFVRTSASVTVGKSTQANVFDDKWHHVAVTGIGGKVKMYVDGVIDTAFTYTPQTVGALDRFAIGAVLRASASNFFNGSISDVRIYRRVLTLEEVALLAGVDTPSLPPLWRAAPPTGVCPAPTGPTSNGSSFDEAPLADSELWDNFTGAAGDKPDARLWVLDTINQGGIQTYSPDHCYLDGNGHLVLRAIKNPDGSYVAGRFTSRKRFNMRYGWCAASIKFPSGVGYSPAAWMLGVRWPEPGSEIDLIEFGGGPATKYTTTVHATSPSSTGVQYPPVSSVQDGPDLSNGFHTYWVNWESNRITIGIDDLIMGSWTPESWAYPAAFDGLRIPFYWIFNFAIGGWLGNPNASTPFPAYTLIDWVWYKPL